MVRLYSLWASGASFDSFAHALVINSAADANDHENDLHHMRMIVKNHSQLTDFNRAQETGGMSASRLAMCVHDDCYDASERTLRCL